MFKELDPKTAGQNSEVALSGMTGPIFLMTVKGDLVRDYELTEFIITGLDTQKEELKVKTDFINKGNVHIKPEGRIVLEGLGEIDFNEPGGSVLPNSERIYEDNYKLEKVPLIFEKYRAELKIEVAGKQDSAQAEYLFINWKTIIIIAVFILIQIVLYYVIWKKGEAKGKKNKNSNKQ